MRFALGAGRQAAHPPRHPLSAALPAIRGAARLRGACPPPRACGYPLSAALPAIWMNGPLGIARMARGGPTNGFGGRMTRYLDERSAGSRPDGPGWAD
jgi:hypothetical protein